jgi:hypothetical protein
VIPDRRAPRGVELVAKASQAAARSRPTRCSTGLRARRVAGRYAGTFDPRSSVPQNA